MMMAGASLGVMALGLVYTVSRAVIYLAGGALAVSLLAAAYPPLSSLAVAYVVIAVMVAIVLAWMVRKREE
jgi:subtilase family serine protease